jgi:hypothetical protein
MFRRLLAMVPLGLGITCAHVGGLVLTDTTYHPGAGPCGDAETVASSSSAIAFSKVLMIIAALALAAY